MTNNFTIAIDQDAPRTLVVNGFTEDYEYRITPVTSGNGRLKCDDVDGNPNVEDFAYFVVVDCIGDIDDDGYVDVLDLLDLLSNWGTTDCETGLNADGDVDVVDLNMLLGHWGECGPIPSSAVPDCVQDCLDTYSDPQDRIDCIMQCE